MSGQRQVLDNLRWNLLQEALVKFFFFYSSRTPFKLSINVSLKKFLPIIPTPYHPNQPFWGDLKHFIIASDILCKYYIWFNISFVFQWLLNFRSSAEVFTSHAWVDFSFTNVQYVTNFRDSVLINCFLIANVSTKIQWVFWNNLLSRAVIDGESLWSFLILGTLATLSKKFVSGMLA